MQEKPLLVILLAVRVFAQLFIFDSQPTEGPIYFRLSTNGGAYGIGREAQLLGGLGEAVQGISNRPCSLGLPGLSSVCVSPGPPLLPASPRGLLLFTRQSPSTRAPGTSPLCPAQASGECTCPFICSIIHSHHFACMLIFIGPSSGGKAVLCAGGS